MFDQFFWTIHTALRRFYKDVNIVKADGSKFEIILDKRRLKTPRGHLFYVKNEPLAMLVANEWRGQKDVIKPNQMHLTALGNTVIDNPNGFDQDSLVEKLISFLESDTMCFRLPMPEDLLEQQSKCLDPVVQWFAQCYQVSIPVTTNVFIDIDDQTKSILNRYLKSFNIWSLNGLLFMTENLKSLILACALMNRELNVQQAIDLSRIEENYQAKTWGKVEFHHDLDMYNLQMRVSAALLFTMLNWDEKVSHKTGNVK